LVLFLVASMFDLARVKPKRPLPIALPRPSLRIRG
jgi:hypothetical protein